MFLICASVLEWMQSIAWFGCSPLLPFRRKKLPNRACHWKDPFRPVFLFLLCFLRWSGPCLRRPRSSLFCDDGRKNERRFWQAFNNFIFAKSSCTFLGHHDRLNFIYLPRMNHTHTNENPWTSKRIYIIELFLIKPYSLYS